MEKRFEDAFKEKFDGAEMEPSEPVWNNIELALARAEGGDMKRRILFFKLMAAASVGFAMVFSGATYYMMQQQVSVRDGQLAVQRQVQEKGQPGILPSVARLSETQAEMKETSPAERQHMLTTNRKPNEVQSTSSNSTPSVKIDGEEYRHESHSERVILSWTRRERMGATTAGEVALLPAEILPGRVGSVSFPAESGSPADPVAIMMAQLAERERMLAAVSDNDKDQESDRDRLWAAVGVAAGGFNTVNPGYTGASTSSVAFQSVAQEQTTSSGMAYSMGVSMGTQLSSKWVLQGGVNYLTQTYDYTANTIATSDFRSFEASSLNTANQSDTKLLASSPYAVNNNMQYLSIPVQAGYLIVDKKLGVMLNAGVATDFFIRNTVTPSSSSLSRTTQGSGADSPYRAFNFSGLMGTEFTYQLGKQYRLALAPGIRYPLNSIYKESTGVAASPITFDVGMKFRYLFP